MYTHDLLLAARIFLLSLILGIISLPFSLKFFNPLIDRGYFLGKLFGLFMVSYIVFFLATLRLLPLGFWSLLSVLLIWLLTNCYIFYKDRNLHIPWKIIFFEEFIFIFLFSIFVFIKGHNPEIYQIERFMDFGFIKALSQTRFCPWKIFGNLVHP